MNDEITVCNNMPFFLETLARRFDIEGCQNLPDMCRAAATEIETTIKERDDLLEGLRTGLGYEAVAIKMKEYEHDPDDCQLADVMLSVRKTMWTIVGTAVPDYEIGQGVVRDP